jgi:hypothetical protein
MCVRQNMMFRFTQMPWLGFKPINVQTHTTANAASRIRLRPISKPPPSA